MTATTTAAQLVLQDSRSKLFYNKDLGGFSEPDKNKATRLDVATSQAAFVKAHFQRPEFIVEVPLEDTPPTPAQIVKVLQDSPKDKPADVTLATAGNVKIVAAKNPFKNGFAIVLISATGQRYGFAGYREKPSKQALAEALVSAKAYAERHGI